MAPASPEVLIAPAAQLAAEFARRATERAHAAVRERGVFTLAIPGGSIARAFLPALDTALPWESTELFWVDERAVPEDDPESNAGMAKALLATGRARARGWHPIHIGPDLDASAQAYGDRLVERLGTPPVIDLILLGIGQDGHVASLFPGGATPAGWVAAVHDAPKPPRHRVTLTLATLTAGRLVCIAALGEGKAAIATELLERGAPALPAARVLAAAYDAWVFLDPGAASQLRAAARQVPR
jgi:6-phosphogluconolactonase